MRRMQRLAPIVVVMAMVAACGGSGEGGGVGDDFFIADAEGVASEMPDDFYLPDDMTVGFVTDSDIATSLSGTMESGDPASVQAEMVAGLQAAGYELLSNDDDIAVFVKNGVGRVRVRTSVIVDNLTLSVDIDKWTDEQIDEMRALLADPIVVPGRAVAVVAGERYEAVGECRLKGANRMYTSDDAAITVQIDETRDPPQVYADVTTPDGEVYVTEFEADLSFSASDQELTVSGEMTDYTDENAGAVDFTATATCDDE